MIIQEDKRVIETTGVTEQKNFTIAATSKAFKILSDGLYQDKILAVVRELICNAWDAHVAAKASKTPIEIHLPNMLEPWFHVKDFGTGLSHDNVMTLYTTYFGSSKTASNDFIGALGLGSKSPFSYVDSFTVESRFDGTTASYNCLIGEDGAPNIKVLSKYDNKSVANGMTVTVPVKGEDFKKFETSLRKFITRMEVPPKVIGVPQWKVDPTVYSQRGTNWAIRKNATDDNHTYRYGDPTPPKAFAVQGLVAYPINTAAFSGLDNNEKRELQLLQNLPVDIFFPIGELEVTASRESLSYDLRTQKNILARVVGIKKEIEDKAASGMPLKSSTWEKLKWYQDNYQFLSDTLSVLKGYSWAQEVEKKLSFPKSFTDVVLLSVDGEAQYVNGNHRVVNYKAQVAPNGFKDRPIFNKVTIDPLIVAKQPYFTKKEWTYNTNRYTRDYFLYPGAKVKIFYSKGDLGSPTIQTLKNISKYIIDNPSYNYWRTESKTADLMKFFDGIDGCPVSDILVDIDALPEYKVAAQQTTPKVKHTAKVYGLMGIKTRGYSGSSNVWKEVSDQTEIATLLSKPFYYLPFEAHDILDLQGRYLDSKESMSKLIDILNTLSPKVFTQPTSFLQFEYYRWNNPSTPVKDVKDATIWRVTKEYHGYFQKQSNAINVMDYAKKEIESFILGNHDKLYPQAASQSTSSRDVRYDLLTFIHRQMGGSVKNTEFNNLLLEVQTDKVSLEASQRLWQTWETLKKLGELIGFDHEDFVKTNKLTEFWDVSKVKDPSWSKPLTPYSKKLEWMNLLNTGNCTSQVATAIGGALNEIPS